MNSLGFFPATSRAWRKSRTSFVAKCCFVVVPLMLCAGPLWCLGAAKTEAAKVEMTASPEAPAAHGEVLVKSAPNGNLQLDIKAAHLAEPSVLTPAGSVYVVWLEGANESPIKLGEMPLGKNLSGEVRTITPFKRFRILITPEQNAEEDAPQAQPVLSADFAE